MSDFNYDSKFYAANQPGSLRSARIVVPILLEIIKPKSVIDVGCGTGTWLKAFQENGVIDIRGIDGDYVDRSKLVIDSRYFTPMDLRKPLEIEKHFDLAISLEVAEHLPTKVNRQFVKTLVSVAPIVLFSAAIPGQGGEDHRNTQWPQYWSALFAGHGYRRLDPIRFRILSDTRVESWYRQNTYLFASESAISQSPRLQEEAKRTSECELDVIYTHILKNYQTTKGLAQELPKALWRSIVRRFLRQQ
jgi:SAM-dependent methyltransferase